MNPVGLGCMSLSWAYGTPPSVEDGAKLLHRALDIGYNHLDTDSPAGGDMRFTNAPSGTQMLASGEAHFVGTPTIGGGALGDTSA